MNYKIFSEFSLKHKIYKESKRDLKLNVKQLIIYLVQKGIRYIQGDFRNYSLSHIFNLSSSDINIQRKKWLINVLSATFNIFHQLDIFDMIKHILISLFGCKISYCSEQICFMVKIVHRCFLSSFGMPFKRIGSFFLVLKFQIHFRQQFSETNFRKKKRGTNCLSVALHSLSYILTFLDCIRRNPSKKKKKDMKL